MPLPPTGTVTFLFTDIEGSSRHWEQHPEAMKIALARHDAILRSTLESRGAHVFKTVGDAFYAAFCVAPDALAAALEAQRELATEDWTEIGGLRVRMALHTGAVHEREGDYFGPPLNRIARLLNAGHGGQTLLSLAAEELIRDHLPSGTHLRDLGTHRLHDLIRPEQVFELVAPPLPADFPPLKTLDAHPNNLQTQPTPLLGREGEVQKICAQLHRDDLHLLTLTGPGGTGKTRLGLQVAAELLEEFKDGVFFIALAPLSDCALVSATIAQALDVQETGARSAMQCLQDYLREKSMLLVLDNFERLTDAAPQVAELLANASRLKILVTSRIPLHLRGEYEFAVPPLALPNCRQLPSLARLSQYTAVELFIERARAVRAEFAVNNENASAVAEICVRLDGLPLAIELAAARVKLLSPQAMVVRLKEPLKLLTGGARDLSARQQTLRGAIAWSHDLLDEKERRLFRRLGVFVGGSTLEAAEAVCNPNNDLGEDIFEVIASLVDKSLLRQMESSDGEPRFLLLETIREYALERLKESSEKNEVQNRHSEFYLGFAEQAEIEVRGFQQLPWLEKLGMEHDNLRTALGRFTQNEAAQCGLRLATALAHFWKIRGHLAEAEGHFETLFALPNASHPTAERAKALCVGAPFFLDKKKVFLLLEESVRLWRELRDKRGLALAAKELGVFHCRDGERAKGRDLLEESLILARESTEKWCLASVLASRGETALQQGEVNIARQSEEECIRLSRDVGDRHLMAQALFVLARVATAQGDSGRQKALYEESLGLSREFKNGFGIADGLKNLATLAYNTGDFLAAQELSKGMVEVYQKLGYKPEIARALWFSGEVARCQGRKNTALCFYSDFLIAARASGDDDLLAEALTLLGLTACYLETTERGRQYYSEALSIRQKQGDKRGLAWVFGGLAYLSRQECDIQQANSFFHESLGAAGESGDREFYAANLRAAAQRALDDLCYIEARRFLEESMALSRELQIKDGIAWTLCEFGHLAHYQAQYKEAAHFFEEAFASFRDQGFTFGVAYCLLDSAKLEYVQERFDQAKALLDQSMDLFKGVSGAATGFGGDVVGYKAGEVDITWASHCLGWIAYAQGEISVARAAFRENITIFGRHPECGRERNIAETLAGIARIAIAEGDAERSVQLLGAAESIHKIIGPRLSLFDHHSRASVLKTLRSILGEAAFASAWAKGMAMTTEEAVVYALNDQDVD